MAGSRLPDFVIIGAMKAGTTTLWRWLEQHDAVWLPEGKEPQFLDDPDRVGLGIDAYAAHFADAPDERVTGEASANYADAKTIDVTAATIAAWLPAARLIYLVRDPVERLRSHYRHEVQRGREARPLAEATAVGSPYVSRSCYADVVRALHRHGLRDQLLVVSFEELTGPDDEEWHRVLAHLGLAPVDRPGAAYNRSAAKGTYRPAMRFLHDRGLVDVATRVPASLRRRLRGVAIDDSEATSEAITAASNQTLPAGVIATLDDQASELAKLLSRDPLW